MRFGLKDKTIQQLQKVFANYPDVNSVVIYGSRAKGDFYAGSDIDLTLKGNNINHSILNKIDREIDDLLLPYTFDLSIYDHINDPDLLDHINRIGVELYNKNIT